MPVFILLLFVGAGLLWLLLSFCFIPLGKVAYRLYKDAHNAMSAEEPANENESEK